MDLERYNHLLAAGSVWPLTDRAFLTVTGSDRIRYINGQVTNDVRRCSTGATLHACVCNAKGKMEGELFVRDWPERKALLLDFPVALAESLPQRLEKYVISDDVAFADPGDAFYAVHAFGVPADRLRDLPPEGTWVSPANRIGTPGLDVFFPTAEVAAPWLARYHALNQEEVEILRILNGIPVWGSELGPDVLPPEAGLETRSIDYHKGCYVGQETISRLHGVGQVNRKLYRLVADDGVPVAHETMYLNNEGEPVEVGKITSTTIHPLLDRAIALAYLNRKRVAPGLRLTAASASQQQLCRFEPLESPPLQPSP